MKAVVCTRFGPPEVLQIQQVAKPVPKDHEALIRIYATTVTAGDCELRGLTFPLAFRIPMQIYMGRIRPGPLILGQDLAGEIEAVGKEVTQFSKGDQVIAWTGLRLGTYAEYTCLPQSGVMALKPSNMSYEEAAALPVGGLEAAYFLRRANIQPGQKMLVNGAGGTIGTFAIQIARYFGAHVTAVDSTEKLDMLRSIGADEVIDYTQEDFVKSGETYDVIFDVIGKASFSHCVRLLRPDGSYLLGNPRVSDRLRAGSISRRNNIKVIPWATRTANEYTQDFKFLAELIDEGKLKTIVDRCYPLEQTAEAHRYVDTGQKRGHVVISME